MCVAREDKAGNKQENNVNPQYVNILIPSKRGADCISLSLMTFGVLQVTAINCNTILTASVFPEPLSPETTTHWSSLWSRNHLYAEPATANLLTEVTLNPDLHQLLIINTAYLKINNVNTKTYFTYIQLKYIL